MDDRDEISNIKALIIPLLATVSRAGFYGTLVEIEVE